MTELSKRTLLWMPRLLSIAYIAFLSLFALDVFSEDYSWPRTILALIIHLIPALVLAAVLILAWRWEWIGAAFYAAAGMLYVITTLRLRISAETKLDWIVTIAGPAFLIGTMFFASWLKHRQLQSH